MIALIWAKIGKWVGGVAAVIAALAALFLAGRHRGVKAQAQADAVRDAKATVQAAQESQATVADASAAASAVASAAQTQPAPDTVKRDDLNNSF